MESRQEKATTATGARCRRWGLGTRTREAWDGDDAPADVAPARARSRVPRDGLDVQRLAGRVLRCLLPFGGRFRNAVVGNDNHLGGGVLGVIARLREPGGGGRARRGRRRRPHRLSLGPTRTHGARWLCPAVGGRDGFGLAPRKDPSRAAATPCREWGEVGYFQGLRTHKKDRCPAHTLTFSRVESRVRRVLSLVSRNRARSYADQSGNRARARDRRRRVRAEQSVGWIGAEAEARRH